MLLLHHYANMSVNSLFDGTMPIYDGNNYYIPPFHSVILVPCNSDDPEHREPSNTCRLLTSTGVQPVENVTLLIVYMIENASSDGLLLRHGDVLGANYTGQHAHIKAERSYMLISNYQMLMAEQTAYYSDIENVVNDSIDEEDETINEDDPTLDDVVLMSLNENATDAMANHEKS
jgi:hypothetical protein